MVKICKFIDTNYSIFKFQCAGCFSKRFSQPFSILRERAHPNARRNLTEEHGVSPPYPLFGLLPARKLASNPKSPHPSPLPREREQVAAAPKVRRVSRIA